MVLSEGSDEGEVPTTTGGVRERGGGERGGGGGEASLLKPRTKGKHLDRPWHLTYLRKQGSVTPAQKNAIRNLWPRYGVEITTHSGAAGVPPPRLDLRGAVFPHRPDAPLVLEIGFGLGHSLLEMAAAHPERNFIGVVGLYKYNALFRCSCTCTFFHL